MAADHVPAIPPTPATPPSPARQLPHPVRLLRSATTSPLRPRRTPHTAVFEQVGRPTAGAVTWLWAQVDLDMATVVSARRELAGLLAPGSDPGNVLVYLGPERFVDLRGLRLLLDTARRVRAEGGALVVVAPPRCLQRLVQLARVDAELPVVLSARQATWWVRTRGTRPL